MWRAVKTGVSGCGARPTKRMPRTNGTIAVRSPKAPAMPPPPRLWQSSELPRGPRPCMWARSCASARSLLTERAHVLLRGVTVNTTPRRRGRARRSYAWPATVSQDLQDARMTQARGGRYCPPRWCKLSGDSSLHAAPGTGELTSLVAGQVTKYGSASCDQSVCG